MFVSMVVLGTVCRYSLMFAMFVLSFSDFNPSRRWVPSNYTFRLLSATGDDSQTVPRHPKSSKYLVSRCLEPLKAFIGDVQGLKHLLSRYLDV